MVQTSGLLNLRPISFLELRIKFVLIAVGVQIQSLINFFFFKYYVKKDRMPKGIFSLRIYDKPIVYDLICTM